LDKKYELANKIKLILGKYENPGHIEVLNNTSILKLDLD
jgi:hypothetical protein